MSKAALHVFVYKGYYGVREKLGWSQIKSQDVVLPKKTVLANSDHSFGLLSFILKKVRKLWAFLNVYFDILIGSESSDEFDSNKGIENKKFVITLSADEWKEIQPKRIQLKQGDKKDLYRIWSRMKSYPKTYEHQ